MITVAEDKYGDRCCTPYPYSMAEICPTKKEPVKFKIWFQSSRFRLGGVYKSFLYDACDQISTGPYIRMCDHPKEKEVEGSIMLTDSGILKTQIGGEVRRVHMQNDTCVICAYLPPEKDQRFIIKRL